MRNAPSGSAKGLAGAAMAAVGNRGYIGCMPHCHFEFDQRATKVRRLSSFRSARCCPT